VRADPRASKEELWWLVELQQPLTLGTKHVLVRWLEHDFHSQQQWHNESQVYLQTAHEQEVSTGCIFAFGVPHHMAAATPLALAEIDLTMANWLDGQWYN
jgi:hypothetical protein